MRFSRLEVIIVADLSKFDYGISLKGFLKQYGHAIKSKGSTSKMKYFVK